MKGTIRELWGAGQLAGKTSKQIVEFAGDGNIHNLETSRELRDFLQGVELEDLERFAKECLESGKASYSGFFLQDVINELGSRLSFAVEFGAYKGTVASPAPDGVWLANDWTFIAEIKTTDAFRIKLDRLATFRSHVIMLKRTDISASSVLIIVGRQDTGELEAQVRGSKHAWDMRLIGIDALFKLAYLHRDSVEQESVLTKIRAILRPQEYTRVDGLLDVVFETALAASEEEPQVENLTVADSNDTAVVGMAVEVESNKDGLRASVIRSMEAREHTSFKKVRRSLYESNDARMRFSLAVSKNYGTTDYASYWYAFHPAQYKFIEAASAGFAVYGCSGIEAAVALPVDFLEAQLSMLSQTQSVDRPPYWHIFIKASDGRFTLETKKGYADIDVTQYVLKLSYYLG